MYPLGVFSPRVSVRRNTSTKQKLLACCWQCVIAIATSKVEFLKSHKRSHSTTLCTCSGVRDSRFRVHMIQLQTSALGCREGSCDHGLPQMVALEIQQFEWFDLPKGHANADVHEACNAHPGRPLALVAPARNSISTSEIDGGWNGDKTSGRTTFSELSSCWLHSDI